jgi:hypothetical protein
MPSRATHGQWVVANRNLGFWLAFFNFFQIEETEIRRCLWRPPGLDNLCMSPKMIRGAKWGAKTPE